MAMRMLLIAFGGALGALSRYGVGVMIGQKSFPWSTLGINILGSFLLGMVLEAASTRMSRDIQVAVAVGFLGAFTTFSTFSYEVLTLLRTNAVRSAIIYVVLSVLGGLAAAALGYFLAHKILA